MTACVTWSDRWPTEGEVRAATRPGVPLGIVVHAASGRAVYRVEVWAVGVVLLGPRSACPVDVWAARFGAFLARFAGAPCVEPYGAPVGESPDA